MNNRLLTTEFAKDTSAPIEVEHPRKDRAQGSPQFTYTREEIHRNETAEFTAKNTAEGGCGIESYRWDLNGDETIDKTGRQTSVIFTDDGPQEVSLTVEIEGNVAETVPNQITVIHDPDGDGTTTALEAKQETDP